MRSRHFEDTASVVSRMRILSLFVVTTMLIAAPAIVYAENGTAPQYKIGVVDSKLVFDNYRKQEVEYAKLRESRDKMQQPIDELSEQITKDKEYYDAEADTMSLEDRRDLEEKIESALTKYKAEFERAQQDIDRQEKKLLRDILEDIQRAIQEVGANFNYHLIFENGQSSRSNPVARPGGLLYSSTTLNMTQRVIDHLNEQD